MSKFIRFMRKNIITGWIRGPTIFLAISIFFFAAPSSPHLLEAKDNMGDLAALSIEDLMKIEITSVSRESAGSG